MEVNTTRKVTKEVEEIIGTEIYCDVCHKKINDTKTTLSNGYHPLKWYYEVTTGHNDWGNDSIDSIEHKDICSVECLNKEYDKYLERTNNKFNSEYFEVRRAKF